MQLHPGRLTAGTYKSPMKRKKNDLNQTPMIVSHVNLQGCRWWFQSILLIFITRHEGNIDMSGLPVSLAMSYLGALWVDKIVSPLFCR